jgi:hypothetical protein
MRVFVVGMLLALVFNVSAAFANARQHFLVGQDYYTQGRYEKAIEAFEEAYRLDPKPLLLFNISQAYERLGKIELAIDYLERYLKDDPNTDNAKSLRDKIANLKSRLQSTGVKISCNVDGATILVGNKEMGVTPLKDTLGLPAGTHRIKIVKPGYRDFLMTVAVVVGQAVPVEAQLEVDPNTEAVVAVKTPQDGLEAPPPPTIGEVEVEEKSPSKVMNILPWAVAGAGAVGAIVGWGVLGSVAMSKDGTDEGKSLAQVADIIGIAGSALLVGGAVWGVVLIAKKKKGETPEAPTAVVLPLLSRNLAGLGATVSF